jgi:hypothetical protein
MPRRPAARSRVITALRAHRRSRPIVPTQPALLGGLVLVAALYTVGAVRAPTWFPVASASVWLLLGGFFLRLRYLVAYFFVVSAAVATAAVLRDIGPPSPGIVVVLVVTGLLVLLYARGRERVGIQGTLGDSMLVDLRDRLLAQGEVPELDQGWQIESALRPAYGDSFSGDFLVASRSYDGRWVELALVDVSGKGQPAGTRALLLSGAFGGRLGAMERDGFLPAANGTCCASAGTRGSPPPCTWRSTSRPATSRFVPPVIRRWRSCTAGQAGGRWWTAAAARCSA